MKLFNKKIQRKKEKTNPYGLILTNLKIKGNSYVIPDIHGCVNTFKKLLQLTNFSKKDGLFLLGDIIDKGKYSVELLDFIIEMKKEYSIYAIRGNHEEELLLMEEYGIEHLIEQNIKSNNLKNLYNSDLKLKKVYYDFFYSMPYFIELNEHFLVHAGFDFNNQSPFEDIFSMLEIRNWPYNGKMAKNKTIIHGHNITILEDIKNAINLESKIIPLDNGCFATFYEGAGNLTCLCLNTSELIVQKNIDI